MSKDAKNLSLLALLIVVAILVLKMRQRKENTGVRLTIKEGPLAGTEIPTQIGARMDSTLLRICHYQNTDLAWSLNTSCPPIFNGLVLVGDEVTGQLQPNQ